MLIEVGSIISACSLTLEIDGKVQDTVYSVDTETGEIVRYKTNPDGTLFRGQNKEAELETVFVSPDSLHIYLVKPK
jgi:sugar lactone lactonase YvrE